MSSFSFFLSVPYLLKDSSFWPSAFLPDTSLAKPTVCWSWIAFFPFHFHVCHSLAGDSFAKLSAATSHIVFHPPDSTAISSQPSRLITIFLKSFCRGIDLKPRPYDERLNVNTPLLVTFPFWLFIAVSLHHLKTWCLKTAMFCYLSLFPGWTGRG